MSDNPKSEVREVLRYETTDGKNFSTFDSAERHQKRIRGAEHATLILQNGGALADALRALGESAIDPILEQVTKDSKLVIEHWQCRDTPGYQPKEIATSGEIFVWGNAGCWSGSYGSWISVSDVARYARDKRSVLNASPPAPTPKEAAEKL